MNAADENPSALGAFEFPLRHRGQYSDKETNLSYNYFRDYDLNLGRYVQSDPIGIHGGLNTYAYAVSSPTMFVDPYGLFSLSDWLDILKGNIVKKNAAHWAKQEGTRVGTNMGNSLCASGTPPDFRQPCFDGCLQATFSWQSGFVRDFQDACQTACIDIVSKCRAKKTGLICLPSDDNV